MGPAVQPIPGDIRTTLVRMLVYTGGLAALAAAAASFIQLPAGVAALNPPPR
jgi:hypothetical protein